MPVRITPGPAVANPCPCMQWNTVQTRRNPAPAAVLGHGSRVETMHTDRFRREIDALSAHRTSNPAFLNDSGGCPCGSSRLISPEGCSANCSIAETPSGSRSAARNCSPQAGIAADSSGWLPGSVVRKPWNLMPAHHQILIRFHVSDKAEPAVAQPMQVRI